MSSNTTNPEVIFKLALRMVVDELMKVFVYPYQLKGKIMDTHVKAVLDVCATMIDNTLDRLNDASITDEETCFDALDELNETEHLAIHDELKTAMQNSTEFASNSLAIVTKILSLLVDFNIPIHRKLPRVQETESNFPGWDGSGKYKTIKEAVAAVPNKSKTRFIIKVKARTYKENVNLDKSKWNVMMFGEGKTKTIITGKLNFIDETPTFSTATFGKSSPLLSPHLIILGKRKITWDMDVDM
ncbi:hypothetical protein SLEP1_g48352 [Rubroshorea leprosula]|uniref:Pectinesterase n=1 Tax=Rubroshorea leprosula TaxID=152421 RepID=A0AAV5LTC9_9ROSI|nr:hypothetical protein SLEP1_g48352 [Rubroshorea leprosula]